MNCQEARERLLECEPAELRGDVESPLSAHLRRCAECRAVSERLIAAQSELIAELEALAPPRSPTEAAELAMAAAGQAAPEASRLTADGRDGEVDAAPPRRWRRGVAASLAAAAVLAIALLRGPMAPAPGIDPASPAGAEDAVATGPGPATTAPPSRATVDVDVPAGERVGVFRTSDPEITVVWFFGPDRTD